jgi:hypothetical protein
MTKPCRARYSRGGEEAVCAVEAIIAARDGHVDDTQGLNHHSWVEGSLLAAAVAAAVEAAAPLAELLEVGAVGQTDALYHITHGVVERLNPVSRAFP